MFNEKTNSLNPPDERMLSEALKLVSSCKYCAGVSKEPTEDAPIACTKYAGSTIPIGVNIATCLSCTEYDKLCGSAARLQPPGTLYNCL